VLQPNGPLPAAVYWRRRAIAAAVLIAMIVTLIWLVVATAGHHDAEQASRLPRPSGAAQHISLAGPSTSMPTISGAPAAS
jgi:hypothetical protein